MSSVNASPESNSREIIRQKKELEKKDAVKGAYKPNRTPETGKTKWVEFKPPTRGIRAIPCAIDPFEVIEKRKVHTL